MNIEEIVERLEKQLDQLRCDLKLGESNKLIWDLEATIRLLTSGELVPRERLLDEYEAVKSIEADVVENEHWDTYSIAKAIIQAQEKKIKGNP